MQINRTEFTKLTKLYGIDAQALATPNEAVNVGSMLGVLHPGESTRPHRHHDNEQFVIIEGEGVFYSQGAQTNVQRGDIIMLLPGDGHQLENSSEQSLIFISIWWSEAAGGVINKKDQQQNLAEQFIIAPPPTPNGDLHLGHIAGPYLAADILKRFSQQQGKVAVFITGSDDNQSYVALKANQLGKSSAEVAEFYSPRIQSVLEQYQISTDLFYCPLDNRDYSKFVTDYFIALYNSEKLRVQSVLQPYCESCQHWLFEAHISGQCSYCQAPCGGGSCDTCGNPNQGKEIINSYCKYCRTSPQLRIAEQLYLSLEDYREPLQAYLQRLSLPASIRRLVRQQFNSILPDIPITQFSHWGIVAPFSQLAEQRLCSWAEMVPAYIWSVSIAQGCEPNKIKESWLQNWNQNQCQLTLTFGFDNSFFYLFVLPALLLAFVDSTDNIDNVKLPDNIVANEYYLFDQLKFSTSRQHAVWAHDIVQKVESDMLRYYLAATRPEIHRTNFNYHDLVQVINEDLAEQLSSWLRDLSQRLATDFNNCCPDGGEWNQEHDAFCWYLNTFIDAYPVSLSTHFSPSHAIRLLRELVIQAQRLAATTNYLRDDDKANRLEYQTSIVLELTAAKYYALASSAIMPSFAQKLAAALNLTAELSWESELRLLKKGTIINGLDKCLFQPLKLEAIADAMRKPLSEAA